MANSEREAPGGVVAGWKLVPVEPTDEMMRSAFNKVELVPNASPDFRGNNMAARRAIFSAMLAAAPSPPAAGQCGGDGARERALREAISRGRQKLATYVSIYTGDKELRGLLETWDALLAAPAEGGRDG